MQAHTTHSVIIQKIFPSVDSNPILAQAAAALRHGKLIAFPTETVYGLGADAGNDTAVAEIFAAKGRPLFNPLIVHVFDTAMAARYADMPPMARRLAEAFWPGPLALVLPRKPGAPLSHLATAGLDTVALRAPAHPGARALLEAFGAGIAAPSANRSGRVSPTLASHVAEEFAGTDLTILDGGPCEVGLESTVVDITGEMPVILRPGAVTPEMIEAAVGAVEVAGSDSAIKSPGQLEKHYAPRLPVKLNIDRPESGDALLAFGPTVPSGAKCMINLSEKGDLTEAAARLFAALRELDRPEFLAIAVMPIPQTGLGIAINDRLRRAAVR